MTALDYFTHTEADAAAFERHHHADDTPPPDWDYDADPCECDDCAWVAAVIADGPPRDQP